MQLWRELLFLEHNVDGLKEVIRYLSIEKSIEINSAKKMNMLTKIINWQPCQIRGAGNGKSSCWFLEAQIKYAQNRFIKAEYMMEARIRELESELITETGYLLLHEKITASMSAISKTANLKQDEDLKNHGKMPSMIDNLKKKSSL